MFKMTKYNISLFICGIIWIILSTDTAYASRPELDWVGTGSFATKGVHPLVGNIISHYIFMVKYTDDENNPPLTGYPQVFVCKGDSVESFTLNEIDPADSNYKDGKLYGTYTELNKFSAGTYSYYFESADNEGTATGSATIRQGGFEIYDWWVYNTLPTLEEANVVPLTGNTSSYFTYYVTYTDPENNPPNLAQSTVVIDGAGGLYLQEMDSTDWDFTDGKEYYSPDYSGLAVGAHTFYFLACEYEGNGNVRTTEKPGPTISTTNTAPTLTEDTVTPSSGNYGSLFFYQVKYTDAQNNPPEDDYPKVYILDGGGEITNRVLTPLDPADLNYIDGKLYGTAIILSLTDSPPHKYYFATYEKEGDNEITTSTKNGPLISSTNTSPKFIYGTVTPSTGNTTTSFVYHTIYCDNENNPPDDSSSFPRIYIYKEGEDELINLSLIEVDPTDIIYTNGKEYYVTYVFVNSPRPGQYKYYFDAWEAPWEWEGQDSTRYGTSTTFLGPIIPPGPLASIEITDEEGNVVQDIAVINKCTYTLFALCYDGESVQIPGLGVNWELLNTSIGSISPGTQTPSTYTLFTALTPGTGTLMAFLDTITSYVQITVLKCGTPTNLSIGPINADINSGNTIRYYATATDIYGNIWDITGSATYLSNGGGWFIDNQFTGTSNGTFVITISYAELVATTTVNIFPGTPTNLDIGPKDVTITAGDIITYYATATDTYGNSWDITSSVTYLTEGGLFIGNQLSGTHAGSFVVTANYGSLTATTTVTILTGTPTTIEKLSGDTQRGTVTTILSPFVIKLMDIFGNPIGSHTVNWAIAAPTYGAMLSATSSITNNAGTTAVTLTLGTKATTYQVTVSANVHATFTATATPGTPTTIEKFIGDAQIGTVTTILNPFIIKLTDMFGNLIGSHTINWAIATPTYGAMLSATSSITSVAGTTAVTLTLGTKATTYQIIVSANSTATFTATATPGTPTTIEKFSGDTQTGTVTTILNSFIIKLTDMFGNVIGSHTINWAIAAPTYGAMLSATSSITNNAGTTAVTLTLGTKATTYQVTVLANPTATFRATAIPGTPTTIEKFSGDTQTGTVTTILNPFIIKLTDMFGNVIGSHTINWAIVAPTYGAMLSATSSITSVAGTTAVTLTLGTKATTYQIIVSANSTATFTATATPGTPTTIEKFSGDTQTGTVTTILNPFIIKLTDMFGNVIGSHTINWAIVAPTYGAMLSATSSITSVAGTTAVTLTLGTKATTYQVTMSANPTATFTATAIPGTPTTIEKFSGDTQTGTVTTILKSFIIKLTDMFGNIIGSHTINWAIAAPTYGAMLSATLSITSVAGTTAVTLTLGTKATTYQIIVSANSTATFTATATPGTPTTIEKFSGDTQTGTVTTILNPFIIKLTDMFGNVIGSHTINWAIVAPTYGAMLSATSSITSVAGTTAVTLTLGTKATTYQIIVSANSTATFTATATPGTPTTIEKFSGDTQTGTVTTILNPFVIKLTDMFGNIIGSHTINWAIATPTYGAMLSATLSITSVAGTTAVTLTLGTKTTTYQIIVSANPTATFTATAIPGTPTTIEKFSGDTQTGTVTTILNPFVIKLTDMFGNIIGSHTINWAIATPTYGAMLSATSSITSVAGTTAVTLTLGTKATTCQIIVSANPTATFTATAIPGTPTTIEKFSGDTQTGTVTTILNPFIIKLTDMFGNVIGSHTINWAIVAPTYGAMLSATSSITSVAGTTAVTLTLGTKATTYQIIVSANSTATFTATATPGTPTTIEKFSGDTQTGTVTTILNPFVIKLTDMFGNIIGSHTINWAIATPTYGAMLSATSSITSVAGTTAVTLTLGTKATTYQVTVSANVHATFTATATPGTPTTLSITPKNKTICADNIINYYATATDTYGNAWDVTDSATYSSTGGGSFIDNQFTGTSTGTFVIIVNYMSLTATTTVTICSGTATTLTIVPKNSTISAGGIINYYATATDTYGNAWDVTDSATYSSTGGGSFINNRFTGTNAGTFIITVNYSSLTATTTVKILPGTPTALSIAPKNKTISAGNTINYHTIAEDTYGNTWDVTDLGTYSSTGGGFFVHNQFKGIYAGTFIITVNYSSLTATTTVKILPGTPTALSIAPKNETITAGNTINYYATATDIYKNSWDVTGSATYSSTGGGSFVGNQFTSTNIGTFIITTNYSSLTATTTITMLPGTPTRMSIIPSKAYLPIGSTTTFVVYCYNQYDVSIPIPIAAHEIEWIFNSDIGTLSQTTGTSTEFLAICYGMGTITARISKFIATAVVMVIIENKKGGVLRETFPQGQELIITFEPYANLSENDYYILVDFPEEDDDRIKKANTGDDNDPFINRLPDTICEIISYDTSDNKSNFSGIGTVTIAIYYRDINQDSIVDGTKILEETLRLYCLYESLWIPIDKIGGEHVMVDTKANCVITKVVNFSIFVLQGHVVGEKVSNVAVWPNPFKSGRGDIGITFENLPRDVTIKIYDISGELVSIKKNINCSWFFWDLNNDEGKPVASGIYLYVITDAQNRKYIGKVGVIK